MHARFTSNYASNAILKVIKVQAAVRFVHAVEPAMVILFKRKGLCTNAFCGCVKTKLQASPAAQVSEISGGITNLLWLLTPDRSSKLQPVVLRVFGKQTDKIIDRDREAKILPALNAAGFGAQVISFCGSLSPWTCVPTFCCVLP